VTLLMEKPESCSITINGTRIDVPRHKPNGLLIRASGKFFARGDRLKGPNEIVLDFAFRKGVES